MTSAPIFSGCDHALTVKTTQIEVGTAQATFAEVVLYMGDRDGALALYRKALETDPGFTSAAENIERILDERGD